jgi:hypothetical protein
MDVRAALDGWNRRLDEATAALARPANVAARSRAHVRALCRRFLPAGLLLLAASLLSVWLRIALVDVAYRLEVMKRAVEQLEQEQRELELERAAAESPRRLAEAGRALGLGPARWGREVPLP